MIKLRTILEKLGYTENEIEERLAEAKEIQLYEKEFQDILNTCNIKTVHFDEKGNEIEANDIEGLIF